MSQHGRPDDGTDATGFFNAEFFAPLKPFDHVAGGHGQGQADRRAHPAADGRIPRRGFQFLAIHRGQRRGSGLGREGREFGQALRQRSRSAAKPPPNRITDGDGGRAGHHRPGGVQLAGPADSAHRHRPRHGRALRACRRTTSIAVVQAAIGGQEAGNLYEDGSDRNFPIMVRLAPEYRGEPGRHPPHPRRRAESRRQRRSCRFRLSRCGQGQTDVGRVLHLSREPGALHPDQIQRARPRSGRRGAATPRRKIAEDGAAAGGLPAGMGRRVRRVPGRHPAAGRDRAAQHLPDRLLALHQFRHRSRDTLLAASVMPMALVGGIFALVSDRNGVQRLGGDRVRRPVRHRGDGRDHRAFLFQPHDRRGAATGRRRSCAPARSRCGRW